RSAVDEEAKVVALIVDLFFFQAEDGIRALIVTGVQTCALPICPRLLRRYPALQRRGRRAPVDDAPPGRAGAPAAGHRAGLRLPQIGRASCRERVYISVGAGSVKKR